MEMKFVLHGDKGHALEGKSAYFMGMKCLRQRNEGRALHLRRGLKPATGAAKAKVSRGGQN